MSVAFHSRARILKGRRGTAAIEFGVTVPLLLLVLMGVVELSFAIYQAMQVYDAAEAGTLYAAKNGWSASGISTAVTGATGTTGIAATPAPTQYWGCHAEGGITVVASSVKCSGNTSPGLYVQVNASLARTTILPYAALGLPATFTARSVVRLQ